MTTYTIEYDLSELKKLVDNSVKGMTTAALPNTNAAFQAASNKVRQMWVGFLTGSYTLPGIDTPDKVTSAMVRSIQSQNKTNETEFHHIVFSENRQLEQLDKGTKKVEYDMKQTHPYGKKSRVSKKGIPYLIIPFRWGTPLGKKDSNGKDIGRAHFNNVIPQKNYETSVSGLEISSVNALKNYFEKNFKGESVERQGYNWAKNGRLTEEQAWDDRSIGMVKMKDITGSTYFTFRIVSAKSPAGSWIYHKDAKPALNYMTALETAAKPEVEKIIRQGIKADEDAYKNM